MGGYEICGTQTSGAISGPQLFPPHGANFPIYKDLPVLNQIFCHAAGRYGISQFQQGL